MNNYEGWFHINTAPKDREVLVWDGKRRYVAEWDLEHLVWWSWSANGYPIIPTHWRGCPPPPVKDDDEE